MILLAYRHGLRASEIVALRWRDIHGNKLNIARTNGLVSLHPLDADEVSALKQLQRETRERNGNRLAAHIFVSESNAPLSAAAYERMIARAGKAAWERSRSITINSNMLRHACGYRLADAGRDLRAIQHYLGHRSIASTARYATHPAAPHDFKDFWPTTE